MDSSQLEVVSFKSGACIACQKRKCKCIGNPCAYCLKKNLVCEFPSVKKRGPKRIKIALQESEDSVVNSLQESMSLFCQQVQFIDFYFQFIGKFIPMEYKENLVTGKLLTPDYRTQLYIIAASMMKMYGNRDLENEYIKKAHKSSDLFSSDTMESAITLMMMTNYLGGDNPKSRCFILVAQNTLQLPSAGNSLTTVKAQVACQVMSMAFDSSISVQQKRAFIFSFISGDFGGLIDLATPSDIAKLRGTRIKILIQTKSGYSDSNVQEFLHSVSGSCQLSQQDYLQILAEIEQMDKIVAELEEFNILAWKHEAKMAAFYRFLLEWLNGNTAAAHTEAIKVKNFFQEHLQVISSWLQDGYVSLFVVAYFFKASGQEELMKELVKNIHEPFVNIRRRDEVQNIWEEICGKKPGYNIAQLEVDLLGPLQTTNHQMKITYPSSSPIMNNYIQNNVTQNLISDISTNYSPNLSPLTPNNTPNLSPYNPNPQNNNSIAILNTSNNNNNFCTDMPTISDNILNNFMFADLSYYHPVQQDQDGDSFNSFM